MKTGRYLAICLIAFMAFSTRAADVAVYPVNVTNLSAQQAEVIGEVMSQQFARLSKKTVVRPAEVCTVLASQNNDVVAAARTMGVSQYILVNAIALETKILVDAQLYNQTGSEQYRAQMTSTSMDDMAEVCDRLARSLLYRVPVEETRELDNITEKETTEQKRLFSEKISGVKTWLMASIANGSADPMAAIGYNMKLESERYFLEFGASALLPADFNSMGEKNIYGGVALEIGGDYYLNNNPRLCPYIGGGISPRFLFTPGCVAVVPYLQCGLMFMRMSSTRLYVDLRIAQNAMPLTFQRYTYDDYGMTTPTSVTAYPTEIGLQVGIGW